MDVRLTWTDCDEAGDYVVPYVLSPRDLVSRTDNMDESVLHTLRPNQIGSGLELRLDHPTLLFESTQRAMSRSTCE